MYYSLYNWIGENEITKLNKKKCFESKQWTQTQAQKDMSEMEWPKMDLFIFLEIHMRKGHLFCTSSHHMVPYEKKQELNKGSEAWIECSPC